jgi:hypothetical protein
MVHPREGQMKPATHFVGFRSDEYTRALRIWKPDFSTALERETAR